MSLPWLLMTGTRDGSPIGNTAVEDQLAVYPALPRGERASRRNPNHHRELQWACSRAAVQFVHHTSLPAT